MTDKEYKALRPKIRENKILTRIEQDVICEALEKQMPKKPILKSGTSLLHVNKGDKPHEIGFNKWVDWVCPSCGWFVGQRYNANQSHHHDQRKSNFCYECGQAIDWSETE